MRYIARILLLALPLMAAVTPVRAQQYNNGLIDKCVAIVGGEMISLSELEQEIQIMKAQGLASDHNMRCELLEQMMESKLFLVQARIDSLAVNQDMVDMQLSQRLDRIRTQLGGDEGVEAYFGKPLYRLRQEWKNTLEDQALTQQEQ